MDFRGQGALEYLLLIGGAVLVAAVVLSLITGIASSGENTAKSRATDAICAPLDELACGAKDPDGRGELVPADCKRDLNGTKFLRCISSGISVVG